MAAHLSKPHPQLPYELVGVPLGQAQFDASDQWAERELLAIVGMGVEPGLSDVFARYARDCLFDSIDEIGVRDGSDLRIDGNDFAPTFSIWTTIEECLNPPIVWERDRGWYTTKPFSGLENFTFPEGIGTLECVNVEHEEVLFVPRHIECDRVTFKYGLGQDFIDVLETLHRLGLDSTQPVVVNGVPVAPRDVVAAVLPNPANLGHRMHGRTCAGTWARGVGLDGRRREVYLYQIVDNEETMGVHGHQAVVWQTAINPVIALELLAAGTWKGHGVHVPEAFDPLPYLELMSDYGAVGHRGTRPGRLSCPSHQARRRGPDGSRRWRPPRVTRHRRGRVSAIGTAAAGAAPPYRHRDSYHADVQRRAFLRFLGVGGGVAVLSAGAGGTAVGAVEYIDDTHDREDGAFGGVGNGQQRVVWSVATREPVVALTFDDGPNPLYTERVLSVLAARDVKASFFMIGRLVQQHPDLVQAVLAAGHEVGNHSWSHLSPALIGAETARAEIDRAADAIAAVAGTRPLWYRPPRGMITGTVLRHSFETGASVAMWSVDRGAGADGDADAVRTHLVGALAPGAVINMHDGLGRSMGYGHIVPPTI